MANKLALKNIIDSGNALEEFNHHDSINKKYELDTFCRFMYYS